jgi:hypothetical protein
MSSTVNNCCGYRGAAGGRAGHRIEDVIPSSAGSGETHSLRRRRRDRQPLRAGRFVKPLMARRSCKGLMASGGRSLETQCGEWVEWTLLYAVAALDSRD